MKLKLNPFLSWFSGIIIACVLLQVTTIAIFAWRPNWFFYRAWEYHFMWANNSKRTDSRWEGVEKSADSHLYRFYFQEKRRTVVSVDSDGFRSVPAGMGPPRLFVQGHSNIFGSGISDQETVPWRLAESTGVATFNGAHGKVLSTLSKPALGQVELVVDCFHERLFASLPDYLSRYEISNDRLQPFEPFARNDQSLLHLLYQRPIRPGYWIPDILSRHFKALKNDFTQYVDPNPRPFPWFEYRVSDTSEQEFANLMETRRRTIENLGYLYVALILPSRQTMLGGDTIPEPTASFGQRLVAVLKTKDFPIVDLFEPFFRTDPTSVAFRYDFHLNANGAALAAEHIIAGIEHYHPGWLDSAATVAPRESVTSIE